MSETQQDIDAVKQLTDDYGAAWVKGDPELLLACYAEDAAAIMSNEEAIVGKEALRELYQYVLGNEKTEEEGGGLAAMAEASGLDPSNYEFTSGGERKRMEISGDLGYIWDTYTNSATPKDGGKPITDGGDSLLIVRRQDDGSWKVVLMMATRSADPLADSQST